jgi:GAG-pre-integrase domain
LNSNKFLFNSRKDEELSELWHKRVGHHSDKILKSMFKFFKEYYNKCEVCRLAKHTRLPFYNSNFKSSEIFEFAHSDVWGPAPVDSYNNFKYYVILIDDFSITIWIYLMKNKSEVFDHFLTFINLVETQYNKKVKNLRIDNGTEFINKFFFKLH